MSDHTTQLSLFPSFPYFPDNLRDYAPWVTMHGLTAPYGECQCGCGNAAPICPITINKKGYLQGEPRRFLPQHHNNLRVPRSAEDRFWEKVDKRAPDDCWEWQASRDIYGYGQFSYEGECWRASRIAYLLTNGSLPNGMNVLHRCDNPPCCNPNHLFAGTQTENVHDMWEKGRANNSNKLHSEAHPMAKLNNDQVKTIRERGATGHTISALAREFKVSRINIQRIIERKIWKHVE